MSTSQPTHTQVSADAIETAVAAFQKAGLRVSIKMGDREQRGRDDTYLTPHAPDAVVFAQSETDVVAAVMICNDLTIPVIPFGAGTSFEGHIAALKGGVSIDLTAMNQIVQVSADDMHVTVQPGVVRDHLNRYLRDTGLFFPIDACPEASIAGMAATRASGTNAVRYGTMRENVVAMRVVLADGRVIKTHSLARKSAAGYDLTRLFVGSAGTLGIITEITVRLHPVPQHISSAICAFPSIEAAARTAMNVIQCGIPIARVEIMDEVQVRACNLYSKLDLEPLPHLFFNFDGTEAMIADFSATVEQLATAEGGRAFQWATTAKDRERLWEARHKALYAALALRPGSQAMPTDVTVPISRLADCIVATKRDFADLPFPAPIVGHVGDGNFHVAFVVDPGNAEEVALAHAANDRMVRRALEMGGTCTGEHGVGYTKNHWLAEEYGQECLDVMRSIKQALDPKGIMNPGKIFD